jgi:hypothetical protein
MHLLSFEEALRRRSALRDNALLRTALEMLWQAYRYAARSGADAWEFAVEIDEFRRAQVSNSELRWLLSQGYAAHAQEKASTDGRRRFRQTPSASMTDASCFIIAEAGVALLESLDDAASSSKFKAQRSSTRIRDSKRSVKRRSTVEAKPSWDAQRRELWIDGRLVKRLRQQSSNQQAILDAFAAAGWPRRIADPLPLAPEQCPKRRLHDAVKCLNRHHRHEAIRFSGDGSASGVLWERIG